MLYMINPKKRKHLDFDVWLKDALKDPSFKAAYNRQQPEFSLMRARIEKGLTQEELAKKMGTKQSVISRFESGNANPSLAFLKRLAGALGARVEIRFVY